MQISQFTRNTLKNPCLPVEEVLGVYLQKAGPSEQRANNATRRLEAEAPGCLQDNQLSGTIA